MAVLHLSLVFHEPTQICFRKSTKMDALRRRVPDYSDVAYREAVTKLKYLLEESYTSPRTPIPSVVPSTSSVPHISSSFTGFERTKRVLPLAAPKLPDNIGKPPQELVTFISRQEEYIDQLEKEVMFCRPVKSKGRKAIVDGPRILYESRISELEAQLGQTKIQLKKAQDEASRQGTQPPGIIITDTSVPGVLEQTKLVDTLRRERDEMHNTVVNLQALVSQLREKEASATQKVKRTLDLVDQAHFDKSQLEVEVKRLKGELERANEKIRECVQDSARRVQEAERRYSSQLERLNADLSSQWDSNNRLSLEVDRARRTEQELRREIAQRNATIDEIKKELHSKTSSLQSEAVSAGVEKESLEAELCSARLTSERAERQARQEAARQQAEIASLRQRLDRADAEILQARKENLRLTDNIASLEKELNISKLGKDNKEMSLKLENIKNPDELSSLIKEMDNKHVKRVSELEGMIQSQSQLMEKLKDECHVLTQKLEDSSSRQKEEVELMAIENGRLDICLQDLSSTSSDLLGLFKQISVESGSCHSDERTGWWVTTQEETMHLMLEEQPPWNRLTTSKWANETTS